MSTTLLSAFDPALLLRLGFVFVLAHTSCVLMYDYNELKVEIKAQLLCAHLLAILVAYVSLVHDKLAAIEEIAVKAQAKVASHTGDVANVADALS